ncbi:MAG TPA: glycosyltransferase [Rhodopila sp.]|uniref:glycosyltransferase n=1 Tax=Rhodopila sp. TaxID=2480087 RepID=UPI002CEDBF36|nr:glycosyltransferase [Rhodopila sp.]HVY15584.1 glycosyltransferase [Rhodopila sp.]
MPGNQTAVLEAQGACKPPEPPAELSAAIYIHDLSPGGVERQTLVLARELRARGVLVTLVVHQYRGELVSLVPDSLPVVVLGGNRTLRDVLDLRRYLRTERPDVLMANVDHCNIAATLAKAVSGTATRLIICQHNPLTPGFHATVNWKHRVVPFAYRRLASWIDHAIAVSNGIADELVNHGGLPQDRVSTIFNAVIGEDFADRADAPIETSAPEAAAALAWFRQRDRPVFLTAGRLVEMKDHRNLLRAFARYLKVRDGRLVILGVGPLQAELQALAESLGIAAHVCFAGFVKNPLPLMRQADAFVLSSRSEGFGNVIVEALGCGTPVVATDCPHGPSDILEHGRYGLMVPPQDDAALAAAMTEILTAGHRFPPALLRERARMFSYRACADGYDRLFRVLVG